MRDNVELCVGHQVPLCQTMCEVGLLGNIGTLVPANSIIILQRQIHGYRSSPFVFTRL